MDPASVLAAYALLSAALQKSDGHDDPLATFLVVASFGLMVWSVLGRGRMLADVPIAKLGWWVALGSALLGFGRRPAMYIPADVSLAPYRVLLGIAAVVILLGSRGTLVKLRAPILAVVFLVLGIWTLRVSPSPNIDVFTFNQKAADLVLHGKSMYAPGALPIVDIKGRTFDGYVYPPFPAMLSALGYVTTGDARYTQLVFLLGGAFLLRRIAKNRDLGDALFACLLFHPRMLFILEEAWIEPLELPFLFGFVLLLITGRRTLAAVVLGFGLALKQHIFFYLPFVLLVPGLGIRTGVIACATMLVPYMPFLLFAREGLAQSILYRHLRTPFRADSLSVSAFVSNAHVFIPKWVGTLLAGCSFPVALRVVRRLATELAASTLPFFLFYMFGTQAFANYYWLIGATMLLAIAARDE